MINHDNVLIDRYGGNCALARRVGITSQAISRWRKNGIPKPWRMYLLAVYPDLFELPSPPADHIEASREMVEPQREGER